MKNEPMNSRKAGKLESYVRMAMEELKEDGRFFFNEAHFQYEFTLRLFAIAKDEGKKLNLTLEYSPEKGGEEFRKTFSKPRVDLLAEFDGVKALIEFKYPVKDEVVQVEEGLNIQLKNQSAFDIRRHDIWKDIFKLEDLLKAEEDGKKLYDEAYFICLSNAEELYRKLNDKNMDKPFEFSEGKYPAGRVLKWQKTPRSGETAKGRSNKPIPVSGEYDIKVENYGGSFKFVILNIGKAIGGKEDD